MQLGCWVWWKLSLLGVPETVLLARLCSGSSLHAAVMQMMRMGGLPVLLASEVSVLHLLLSRVPELMLLVLLVLTMLKLLLLLLLKPGTMVSMMLMVLLKLLLLLLAAKLVCLLLLLSEHLLLIMSTLKLELLVERAPALMEMEMLAVSK